MKRLFFSKDAELKVILKFRVYYMLSEAKYQKRRRKNEEVFSKKCLILNRVYEKAEEGFPCLFNMNPNVDTQNGI